MKNPLTPEHRQLLTHALSELDQAKTECRRLGNCGVDTSEMDKVIAELDTKGKALIANYFPPYGPSGELPG